MQYLWMQRFNLHDRDERGFIVECALIDMTGGAVQSSSVPIFTGTTSWCAISKIGSRSGLLPCRSYRRVRSAICVLLAAW